MLFPFCPASASSRAARDRIGANPRPVTGRAGAAATASDPRRAPCRTRSGSRRLLDRLARLLLRFLEAEHQLVGRVVLEDVAHVGGRLDADLFRRDDLDVVEPLVSVEAALDRFLAHARDASDRKSTRLNS